MAEGGGEDKASARAPAVFISYASQDAEAARRICGALRAAGVEVFLDQSELRGGDAWDQKIRHEIHDCVLFIPLVSQHTQERLEGYFRREWKLAIDRTHDMAEQKPFLVPVVVDGTGDQEAFVPDAFRAVQWTRLPGGETPPAFVERITRLLSPELSPMSAVSGATAALREPARASRRSQPVLLAIVAVPVVVVAALAYFLANKFWIPQHATPETVARAGAAPTAFHPPPHSIAVLPFVNMSGDASQEYFSDGLTEELLNSLSRINELQVAARTSAFSFKGKDTDIGTIARKLNVAAVLEGSVRRSAHTVRITAQLINAGTGFHLWSQTYDRDLGDVLKLQTEIATAVADALKVTLLGGVALKIELGGTRNPAAFDAYLRGLKLARIASATTPMECREPIDAFSEAIALDSNYALAYANRALITSECATSSVQWLQQSYEEKARADAERAIALAPSLAEGYVALSSLEMGLLNLGAADQACARALALAPGNDRVLDDCSLLAVYLGHSDTAISGARHGVALDPLNPLSHRALGDTLRYARRYDEAIAAYQASIAADPEHSAETYALRGLSYYLAGNLSSAQSSCEVMPDAFRNRVCRAVIYDKLGRHADAAAVVAKIMQGGGDAAAYQYAEIFAQWGDRKAALDWLEKAMRLRDPGLIYTKTDPLLDPLRKEPRLQAIERELKFPT
jgi:TolB-like protein/tetratricopeptide (TPR) repeat protein